MYPKCVQCKTFIIAPSVILTQPFNACKKRSVSFDYITQYRFASLSELKHCLLLLNVKIIGIWRQVNEVPFFEMYWAGTKRQRRITQFIHGQCHFICALYTWALRGAVSCTGRNLWSSTPVSAQFSASLLEALFKQWTGMNSVNSMDIGFWRVL